MANERTSGTVDNWELLKRVGMVSDSGEVRRSSPLSSPGDFRELATRLLRAVNRPFDLVVVRDLFGDRVLGYDSACLLGNRCSSVTTKKASSSWRVRIR